MINILQNGNLEKKTKLLFQLIDENDHNVITLVGARKVFK